MPPSRGHDVREDPESLHPTKAPAPPLELRARVLEEARRTPSLPVGRARIRSTAYLAAALIAVWVLFDMTGGRQAGPRPTALVVATALGSAVSATVALWVAAGRGRSVLGRPRVSLLSTVVLVPAACLAWKVLATGKFPDMDVVWLTRPGWRCFFCSALFATPPLIALLYLHKRSDPTHPRVQGAVLGIAASAFSTVFVDLGCPVGYVPHLLLGHLLPMLLFAAFGAAAGKSLLGVHARVFPRR